MSEDNLITISEDRLRAIVHDEIRDVLLGVGLNLDDPLENQKDLAWLRTWRVAVGATGRRAWLTIITVLVTGAVGLFVAGIKTRYLGGL